MYAGEPLEPTHFPHLTQSFFRFPNEQFEQRMAGICVLPIHFPHLAHSVFLFPNEQLEQTCARAGAVVQTSSDCE